MIDFYEAHPSPPCTAPSLSRPIITVVMTYLFVFQGDDILHLSVSLSHRLLRREAPDAL